MRTLAIGDIHGASAALDALLAAVRPKASDRLVFLGDYVDRGPDSAGVLRRLLDIHSTVPNSVFLRGNHELMMMNSRHSQGERRCWLSVGGVQCLQSYGNPGRFDDIPADHWFFLDRECVDSFETDTHIFVHANLDGELPLDEQAESMLFWEFLTGAVHHFSGKTVICGHTSQRSGEILDLGDTICIDTFAHGSGWLTGLDVRTGEFWQANQRGDVRTGQLDDRE
jgi:serine/threonine protein phosphatase 1